MKSVGGISSLHGKPVNVMIHGEVRRVIPLYHPAALIYNRSLIPEMEADLRIVKEEISKIHK
jgi:DNA polymerase